MCQGWWDDTVSILQRFHCGNVMGGCAHPADARNDYRHISGGYAFDKVIESTQLHGLKMSGDYLTIDLLDNDLGMPFDTAQWKNHYCHLIVPFPWSEVFDVRRRNR